MKKMNLKTQVIIGILLGVISGALGHSYLTSPISRSDQQQTETGCRGPACLGPCDTTSSNARTPISIQRGAPVNLEWPRNNHAGGFIRVAWAPTTQSDTHSVFDNNVQQIVCHERGGCGPSNPSDPNGGDNGPADGSGVVCQVNITVPPHLTNGLWTLQWAWFGGAFALGDYYSCVDYQITGGASGSAPTPVFIGGDYTYPGQSKCKFFNTDRLHQCVNEPCNNPVYPLSTEESGPAYGIAIQGSPSSSASGSSSTTAAAPASTTGSQAPVTTGSQAPVTTPATTGSKVSATTGSKVSATTGSKAFATTGSKVHATTGSKSSSTTGSKQSVASTTASASSPSTSSSSSTSCSDLGYMRCASSSSYQTCAPQMGGTFGWTTTQNCPTGLSCHPTGNYIYCY